MGQNIGSAVTNYSCGTLHQLYYTGVWSPAVCEYFRASSTDCCIDSTPLCERRFCGSMDLIPNAAVFETESNSTISCADLDRSFDGCRIKNLGALNEWGSHFRLACCAPSGGCGLKFCIGGTLLN